MILEYHPESDMLVIKLMEGVSSESAEIAPGVVLDFDENDRILAIEIEDASKTVNLTALELRSLPLSQLLVTNRGQKVA